MPTRPMPLSPVSSGRNGELSDGLAAGSVVSRDYGGSEADRTNSLPADPAFGWPAVVLAVVSLAFLYLVLFILPDIPRLTHGDQYINFDNARRMTQGQSLYVDIFQYTPPGTEWLFYVLIKLFGPWFAVMPATQIVTGVVTIWLGLAIASMVLPGWKALLPCLLFLVFGLHYTLDETHHKFSVMLVYAAVAVLIRGRERPRLAAAGLLCGMAACFTQTRILMLPVLAGFVLWEGWRAGRDTRRLLGDQLSLIVPFAAALGAVCGYMIAHVGFARFWYLTVDFPLRYYPRDTQANTWACFLMDYPGPRVTPAGFADWIAIKLLVPFVYLPAVLYLWRNRAADRRMPWKELLLVTLTGAGLFATVGYAPIWQRLCEISLPAFILGAWWMETSGIRPLPAIAWGMAASMLVLAPLRTQTKTYCFMAAPAGEIANFYPNSCHAYVWLFRHVRPGDYFFGPYDPIEDVILQTRDPVPVPYLINDGYVRSAQVTRAVNALRLHMPRYIAGWMNPDDYDDPNDHLFAFGEFLRDNYRLRKTFPNGFQIWESRRSPDSANPVDAPVTP